MILSYHSFKIYFCTCHKDPKEYVTNLTVKNVNNE